MTIQNWLTVAVIIATLIAPTIAEFVKPVLFHLNTTWQAIRSHSESVTRDSKDIAGDYPCYDIY
jgi:hypothetical protein